MVLTYAQILALCLQLGFAQPRVATAVALAESGGYTYADNGYDRGLWQINRRWHPGVSDACAYDVECSTRYAYRLSNGGWNWRPWAAFNNGSYRRWLRW